VPSVQQSDGWKCRLNTPLRSSLGPHGWSRLIRKPFFAYDTYRAIIRQAKLSLFIVDPFGRSSSVLPLITANPVKEIRILIDKDDLDLATRATLFAKEFNVSVEVRYLKPYPIHDRFMVLDGRHVWHLGGSLNTLNKASMVSLVQPEQADEILRTLEDNWRRATSAQTISSP
jgi:hypothetical protein